MHEINHVTVPLMMDGQMTTSCHMTRESFCARRWQVDTPRNERLTSEAFIDFGFCTSCNVPSCGRDLLSET